MMFYFNLCVWLDGEDPGDYTGQICQKTYERNRVYWYKHILVDCLDY